MELKEIVDKIVDFLENKQKLSMPEAHLVVSVLARNYSDILMDEYYPEEEISGDEEQEYELGQDLDDVPEQLPPIKMNRPKEDSDLDRRARELAKELMRAEMGKVSLPPKPPISDHKEGIKEIMKRPMVKIDKKKQQQSIDNGDF